MLTDLSLHTCRTAMQKPQDNPDGSERGPLIDREGKHSQASQWHQLLGCVSSLASVFGVVLGTVCAQALGGTIPAFQLNMWRYVAQVALAVPAFAIRHTNLYILPEKRHVFWLGLLSVTTSSYNLFFYTAVTYLPAGTVGSLEPSLVLMLIAGVAIVRFRVCNLHTILAIVVCVVGVILHIQPHFMFRGALSSAAFYNPICTKKSVSLSVNYNNNTSFHTAGDAYLTDLNDSFSSSFKKPSTASDVNENISEPREAKGYLMTVGSAVSIAIGYVIVTEKLHDTDSMVLVIWTGIFGAAISLVLSLSVETVSIPGSCVCGLLLIGHAFGAGFATCVCTIALQLVSTVTVSLILCLQSALLFVLQYTLMKSINPGKHNAVEIAGAVLVVVGNIVKPGYELFKQSTEEKQ